MKIRASALIFAAITLSAAPAMAVKPSEQTTSMQHSMSCGLPMAEGTVSSLNVTASTATIDHLPVPELNMDAMEMAFKAAKGIDLSAFAAGDRVHFLLTNDHKAKAYRIEAICAVDVSDGLHKACMSKMHETAMKLAEKQGLSCATGEIDHKAGGHAHH